MCIYNIERLASSLVSFDSVVVVLCYPIVVFSRAISSISIGSEKRFSGRIFDAAFRSVRLHRIQKYVE